MEFPNLRPRERVVSAGSPLDTKEQVRDAIDIVDLVGRYVQLRRQGRNYVALCPWHNDSHPSLQVNPERRSFKCWVCDVGGDIFAFMMEIEGVSFPEALAMLADQAGIPLERRRVAHAPSEGDAPSGEDIPGGSGPFQGGDTKRSLYRAMAWAEQQYHECLLHSAEGEIARKYLADRQISDQSIREFHLGFSPVQPDWLFQQAHATEARAKVLETIGILARSQEGGRYDRFRGRLLFSIRDAQDRPIGFGGRVLPESGVSSRAKYVNSPETPLFTKSKHLYGLDTARTVMRKSRTALVMEGYTDCIVAHQFGFCDAVAVLGTALTGQHVRILKRFVDRIVLVLDGDEAGRRRANEILELFVAENVALEILTLPEGMDPADFLLEHGCEAFSDLLSTRAIDAFEHAFRTETDGVDLERDIHRASEALERLVSIVARAPRLSADSGGQSRFREERVLKRLASSFRVPEAEIRRRLTALRRGAHRKQSISPPDREPGPAEQASPEEAVGPIDPTERELLEIVVRHPECVLAARAEIDVSEVTHAWCRKIYAACCRLAEAGTPPTFDRLILEFDAPAIKNLLVEVDETGLAKGVDEPEPLLESLIRSFQERKRIREQSLHQTALREGELNQEKYDLLRRIEEQERARHGISDPTDG